MLRKSKESVADEISHAINYAYRPSEAIGWPPQMEEYIRQMIIDVAECIVNNIYTQQELEEKAENIILDKPEDT